MNIKNFLFQTKNFWLNLSSFHYLLISFLILFTLQFQELFSDGKAKFGLILVKSSLRIRTSPALDGKKIGNIPGGELVVILKQKDKTETIGKTKGRWLYVKWLKIKGWVFGAYVKNYTKISQKSLEALNKTEKEWINITKMRDDWVVFRPCFAGTKAISIHTDKKAFPELTFFLGQDADFYPILRLVEKGETAIFYLYSNWKKEIFKVTQKYIDDAMVISRWENLYRNSLFFIPSDLVKNFTGVKEKNGNCGMP